MRLEIALSVALVLGITVPSAAQSPDKVGARRRVLDAVGKDAVDCGTFAGDPFGSARSLTSEQEYAVSACATKALDEHRAWFFAVEGSAVDSWVATGLMGRRGGGVQVFWYDSAPCGGPLCGESFKAYECVSPWVNGVIRPLMTCSDSKMPQPQRAGRPTTR